MGRRAYPEDSFTHRLFAVSKGLSRLLSVSSYFPLLFSILPVNLLYLLYLSKPFQVFNFEIIKVSFTPNGFILYDTIFFLVSLLFTWQIFTFYTSTCNFCKLILHWNPLKESFILISFYLLFVLSFLLVQSESDHPGCSPNIRSLSLLS